MPNIITAKTIPIGTREYITQLTGIFDGTSGQETNVQKTLSASTIQSIAWATDSAGYILLSWETSTTPETIAILSGNGRWDLGRMKFEKPATATGRIFLSTVGFGALDTYTIVYSGKP